MLRSQAGVSLRQPLATLFVEGKTVLKDKKEYGQIVADELNVKEVVLGAAKKKIEEARVGEIIVCLDTELTDQLREEGRLRELIRRIQDARKKAGLQVGEKAVLQYHSEDQALVKIFEKQEAAIIAAAGLSKLERVSLTEGLTDLPGEPAKISLQ
jgi:isoleucyl-tRNA synthetase